MNITSQANTKKEFYELLKQVNHTHEPILIKSSNNKNNVIMISQKEWDSIQETLFLEATGTMEKVREREKDKSSYTNINDIDWDSL